MINPYAWFLMGPPLLMVAVAAALGAGWLWHDRRARRDTRRLEELTGRR